MSTKAVVAAINTAKNDRKNAIHEFAEAASMSQSPVPQSPDSPSSNSPPSPPLKQQQDQRRSSMTNNSNTNSDVVQNRMNLFVLIRILLRYLERVDAETSCLAKQVLKDCEKKQKRGDSKYPTLAHAVNDRLRSTVGETHWALAQKIRARLVNERRKRQSKERQQERKQKRTSLSKSPSLRTVREEEEEDTCLAIEDTSASETVISVPMEEEVAQVATVENDNDENQIRRPSQTRAVTFSPDSKPPQPIQDATSKP